MNIKNISEDFCNITSREQLEHIVKKCTEFNIPLAHPLNGHRDAEYLLKAYCDNQEEWSVAVRDNMLTYIGVYCGISYKKYLEKNPCFQ